MLSRPHVIAALEGQREAFARFGEQASAAERRYQDLLQAVSTLGQAEILDRLAGIPCPGARPTTERVAGRSPVRPFGLHWEGHPDARAWALHVLQGVTVMAVDGSQITPSSDYSIPVGAVQVGWFENGHQPGGVYEKRIRFEVLVPDELADDDSGAYPDLNVNARRFELECAVLAEYMRQADPASTVCLFDGSLVVSFAGQMRADLQRRYLHAVLDLLVASEETRVPLVGYIDHSGARDLAWMLHWLRPDSPDPTAGDAALLRRCMAWGDRSEALTCARDDALFGAGARRRADPALAYYDRVHFLYLQATRDRSPARLDLPAWLLEDGRLDWVVDVVRAECVVGGGYPYAIETADAVAVITAADRERFFRTFQDFTDGLGVELLYARKAFSKRQRR